MIYKLVRVRGKFTQYCKRVKLDEFKRWYGIKQTNKIVGWTPDYVGAIPSKVVKSFNYLASSIATNFNRIKNEVSSSCFRELVSSSNQQRAVFSAGYTTVHPHLKEYLKDNTTSDKFTVDEILRILSLSNFKFFISPLVNFNDVREIFTHVRVNLKAFSGHYTSQIYDGIKSSSDFDSRVVASKIWEQLKIKPLKNMYLWSILGREKDVKIDNSDLGVEVGTRVVMTTENPMCTLLMWFAQKMSKVIDNSDYKHKTFNISGEFNSNKTRVLIDESYNYDWKLEADWTYYDSNIDTNFLKVAGALICNGLPDNRLHRNISYLIIKSIITKYILLPPGVVIELNRAQPSGHPFGTLVNCYVNTIYWCIIGYKIYGSNYADYMRIEVYGDDTFAYFKNHPNLGKIDQYVQECGLKSEPLLNNFVPTRLVTSPDGDIDFLKRRFNESGIKWNHKKFFDKILYQSKNRNLDEQISLLISYVKTAPDDDDVRKLTEIIINELKSEFKDKLSRETLSEIRSIAEYSKVEYNRYSFHYMRDEFLDSYRYYSNFYSWGVVRTQGEDIYDYVVKKYCSDGQNILMALSHNYAQLFNYSHKYYLYGGLSPPILQNKTVKDVIKEYWSDLAAGCMGYVKRRCYYANNNLVKT